MVRLFLLKFAVAKPTNGWEALQLDQPLSCIDCREDPDQHALFKLLLDCHILSVMMMWPMKHGRAEL